MEEERTKQLESWAAHGANLVSVVLQERAAVLRAAAQERDALAEEVQLLSAEKSDLRSRLQQAERQIAAERDEHRIATRLLESQRATLSRQVDATLVAARATQQQLREARAENDAARVDAAAAEKRIESLMAALQGSLQAEARAKCALADKDAEYSERGESAAALAEELRARAQAQQRRAEEAEEAACAFFARMRGILPPEAQAAQESSEEHGRIVDKEERTSGDTLGNTGESGHGKRYAKKKRSAPAMRELRVLQADARKRSQRERKQPNYIDSMPAD